MPRITIVTPTILRPTLLRTCRSVESQTSVDWEHLVCVDRHELKREQLMVLSEILHPQRRIVVCDVEHRDYGHGCRARWTKEAKGDYIFHLDDDDYLAHNNALSSLDSVTAAWAIFPVMRVGSVFFNPNPGHCNTTVSSYIAKKELAQGFPAGGNQADSQFVEDVLKLHPWETLKDLEPLVVITGFNLGREDVTE